jgi:O-acetyl-ADP-ribose deacetylase (regulator of RNase III)
VWGGGCRGEEDLLAGCYQNSLSIAAGKEDIRTIAFPAVSCGVYGYPIEKACRIALRETETFLNQNKGLDQVLFCCFSESDCAEYKSALAELG